MLNNGIVDSKIKVRDALPRASRLLFIVFFVYRPHVFRRQRPVSFRIQFLFVFFRRSALIPRLAGEWPTVKALTFRTLVWLCIIEKKRRSVQQPRIKTADFRSRTCRTADTFWSSNLGSSLRYRSTSCPSRPWSGRISQSDYGNVSNRYM